MLVKVMAKALIHEQSSSSVAKRLKQNISNALNFHRKGSNPVSSRLMLVKVNTKTLIRYQLSSSKA